MIKEHPLPGTLLRCDFNHGFKEPEMTKLRPVIVISPKIRARRGLCTVVALSTTPPKPVMSYHAQIDINPPLPDHFQSNGLWVKGDMIYTVGFHRLNFFVHGKTDGIRNNHLTPITNEQIQLVRNCVLNGLGLSGLTRRE